MVPAPEVLLDQFLQGGLLPPAYRGRQRLDCLEPGLRLLLVDVQNALNTALRERGNVFEKGRCPNFHFDYVDATVRNAFAFEYEDYAFIAVTMPLIRSLWHMCDALGRSPKVMEILGVVATEQQREAALTVLFGIQLNFVVGHEFAHHDRGHLSRRNPATGIWYEIPPEGTNGSLDQQAQEVDADGWAVYLALTNLMIGGRHESTRAILGLQNVSDESVDEALLSSFILAVAAVLFIFPPAVFDERTLYGHTHPPQAARMNEIMKRVRKWCEQNRPRLGIWITLERFQEIMRTAEDATSELNGAGNWDQQTMFFSTQAGAEYFEVLHEHVLKLMRDEEPATGS